MSHAFTRTGSTALGSVLIAVSNQGGSSPAGGRSGMVPLAQSPPRVCTLAYPCVRRSTAIASPRHLKQDRSGRLRVEVVEDVVDEVGGVGMALPIAAEMTTEREVTRPVDDGGDQGGEALGVARRESAL